MSITASRAAELDAMCRLFRIDTLAAIHSVQSGHPGGSLSVCEILTVLYQEVMHIPSLDDPARDRLVLCKGHAAPMLYCNLIEKGYLPKDAMATLRHINSQLQGHPSNHTPGVDMPSGPLGIGLGAAQGLALSQRMQGFAEARTYAILGDGEINEGAVWETAMSASKFKLANLTAVLDYNKVQLDGTSDEVMPLGDVGAKWRAFGWNVLECDGHNVTALCDAFDAAKAYTDGPAIIIAHTIKGKGVSFMEGKNTWHGKAIDDESYDKLLVELGGAN